MDIRERRRYGLSTLWMPGATLNEAIDLIREAGLPVLELVTGGFDGVVGSPAVDSPGVWPRELDAAALEDLRTRLSGFDEIVVHAGHLDVNIASDNAGIREESCRQYEEALDLAAQVGARRVTFHPGFPSRVNSSVDAVIARCVEFGRRMAERAASLGLVAGYENVGTIPGSSMGGLTRELLTRVLDAIGHPAFGLHFDIGWAVRAAGFRQREDVTETVVRPWLDRFGGRIVSIHLHGVVATTPFGLLHHMPLHLDNLLNFARVRELVARAAPGCPLVFEPLARDAREAVAIARRDIAFLESFA